MASLAPEPRTNNEPESELEMHRRLAGLDPTPVRIEYDATAATQLAVDAVMRGARCSGVLLDLVTGDFVLWDQGRILGWAPTAEAAAYRLTACRAAQDEHDAEDEIPW